MKIDWPILVLGALVCCITIGLVLVFFSITIPGWILFCVGVLGGLIFAVFAGRLHQLRQRRQGSRGHIIDSWCSWIQRYRRAPQTDTEGDNDSWSFIDVQDALA